MADATQPLRFGARQLLNSGWQLAATAPGAVEQPAALGDAIPDWRAAIVPGTVAQSLSGRVDAAGLHDAHDWWYRCHFAAAAPHAGATLFFAGLATLADVWLNGSHILASHNMFVAHRVAVGHLLRADNELVIRFRSLDAALTARRPRPRWKTSLVDQQGLRWFRTTLLGRIPGWTPPINPVGPWRDIALERPAPLELAALDLQAGLRGAAGTLQVDAQLVPAAGATKAPSAATLLVGGRRLALRVDAHDTGARLSGDYTLEDIEPWWPHTHGAPRLYDCAIEIVADGATQRVDCGRIGFRHVALDRSGGRVQLRINDTDIFCRGACWTSDDIVALGSTPERLRQTLQLFRDAGANMLRVGGTMLYESDAFYALCDELGLLVWQDFMFASMDYPFDDAGFRDTVDTEVTQQLQRLQKHPAIAVYCGNSEVEQQAAMVGLPAAEWSHEFFATDLPRRCAELHRGIPYFASTPSEGAMPFHVSSGLAHYYSVSAYRRPLTDVKHAQVKFATECLCFAHIPEPRTLELLHDGVVPPPHHARWKERVGSAPATYDFEAIRDDYLKSLFDVDPAALRHSDLERYFALSRIVSGELMKGVYAEWRRPGNACGGGLVWFGKDFWPGAGWGFIDSTRRPKTAYWYLRRAWAPQALLITDEGVDGLHLHVVNETARALTARVELQVYQRGRIAIAEAHADVEVAARGGATLSAEAMLGRFLDTTYTYRFGPPQHDAIVARLVDAHSGAVLSEDVHFPLGLARPQLDGVGLHAEAAFQPDGSVVATLRSDVFLQNVALSVDDFLPDDNYFHLAPNRAKRIVLTPERAGLVKFKAYVGALNWHESLTLRAAPDSAAK